MNTLFRTPTILCFYFQLLMLPLGSFGLQAQTVDFRDTAKWIITDPNPVYVPNGDRHNLFLPSFGEASLAYLKDYSFKNGTVEVDMLFLGHRSYNGLALRIASEKDYEYFYFRPQASGKMEAVQYAPVFNSSGSWQLFSGKGYNAAKEIPIGRWVHVKVVVKDTQAEVYFDNSEEPVLQVYELKRGDKSGSVGLVGLNGGAFFSNFKVTPMEDPEIPEIEIPVMDEGTLQSWMISQKFPADKVKQNQTPNAQSLSVEWKSVKVDLDGIIDLYKHTPADKIQKKTIFARVTITSEKDQIKKLSLGFSDNVSVFLNSKILFDGTLNHNRYEMTMFVDKGEGIYLNLNKGKNELLLALSEYQGGFGGWGFKAVLDNMNEIKLISE